MAVNVGWGNGRSKGAFYSRWNDRFSKTGKNFVNKHTGEVFREVVWNPATKSWQGVGRPIAIEPKYANLSGADSKITYTPKLPIIRVGRIEVPHRAPIVFGKPTRVL